MMPFILGIGLGWLTIIVALLWWLLLGGARRGDGAAAEREYAASLPAATVIAVDVVRDADMWLEVEWVGTYAEERRN